MLDTKSIAIVSFSAYAMILLTMSVHDLYPRLDEHYRNQIDYYQRQKEEAERLLASITLKYSGQLEFDYETSELQLVDVVETQ